MPLFDYACPKCNRTVEVLEDRNSNISRQCVPCSVIMVKQISTSNFAFKGSGFYVNDYKKKNPK